MKPCNCFFILALAPMFASANPAHLSYNYVDIGVGIGKLQLKTEGLDYDYKAKMYGTELSHQLDNNYFVNLDVTSSQVDDKDRDDSVILELDGSMQYITGTLGYATPIADSSDFVVQLGASHTRDNIKGRFSPGSVYERKENNTSLSWELGIRSLWSKHGFEMNASVAGSNNKYLWTIGGPTYLNDNIAIDISYSYGTQKHKQENAKQSTIGITARFYL